MFKKISHKTIQRLGIAIAMLLLIYAGLGSYFSWHYKTLIRRRLPALSAKVTDSLYDITIQDIGINIFTGKVTVYGMRMAANQEILQRRRAEGRPPRVILDVTVPEATVKGVKWNDLTDEKSLSCRAVAFFEPEIRVQIMSDWERPKKMVIHKAPSVKSVSAEDILIENPVIEVRYSNGEEGISVQTTGGQIKAQDWVFHPRMAFDDNRFFGAAKAEISLTGASYTYPGALYTYGMNSISFNTQTNEAAIGGLRIHPSIGYEDFYNRVGYRQDIYECFLPTVIMHQLDWKTLISKHTFYSANIDFLEPDFAIFYSKKPPISPISAAPNLYPMERLKNSRLCINVPFINIENAAVRYSELNNKTGATGTLEFDYLNGNIFNVTNNDSVIKQKPLCTFLISGKFMHRTNLLGKMDFALNSKKGAFSVNARVQDLEASQIKDQISALAIANLKSIQISQADIHIAGNKDSTWGKFSILYNNLKVKLKTWDPKDSDIHDQMFLSFLANKLLLYDANPMPNEAIRSVTTSVARGGTRSFFMMLWKNIFQACLNTAIREEGALDIVKRKMANKGKPKRAFFKDLFPKKNKSTSKGK